MGCPGDALRPNSLGRYCLVVLLDNLGWCRQAPDDGVQHGFRPLPQITLVELPNGVGGLGDDHMRLFFQAGLSAAEVCEGVGGDHDRGDTPPLQFSGNVATPRCAGASITRGCDHHVYPPRQAV